MLFAWLSVNGVPGVMCSRPSIADNVGGSEPSWVTAALASARCLASESLLTTGGPQSRLGSPAASITAYLRAALESAAPDGATVTSDPDLDTEPQPMSHSDRRTAGPFRLHEVITDQTSWTSNGSTYSRGLL